MPSPGATQLARRSEAGALGDRLHVETRAGQKLPRQRDAHAVHIFGDAHARMHVEQAGEIARARRRFTRQRLDRPLARGIGGDGVLSAVNRWMDVIAPFEPGRELRVVAAAPQIDDEMARDGAPSHVRPFERRCEA